MREAFLTTVAWATLLAPLSAAGQPARRPPFTDKTLVAWVRLANTTQHGGGVLTLENPGGQFDALVFGELRPGRWMAGSDFFRRSHQDQESWPAETADPRTVVQVAAVYRGKEVTLYRDGRRYTGYALNSDPVAFSAASTVLMGLRHRDAGGDRFFAGAVRDARIYDAALSPEAVAALKPKQLSEPRPLAWWTFDDGKAEDRMNTFPAGHLLGDARIAGGELLLAGAGDYLLVNAEPPRSRAQESWPTWHISARPEEGVCLPYDANGCIYWKGRYHLMYIFQDHQRPHGGHCWGHLSSTDLVNWTFHPPALVPEKGDPDVGIFSGNAFVNKEGQPMLCWFGIEAGVCLATAADDGLIRWKKHPKNPVIPMPKPGQPGHGVYKVWDPFVWLEGDTYYCLLGGNQLANGKDTLYLCKSPDLVSWKPLHPFYEHPDLTWTTAGEDCSCPDFFRLGDKHVLMCISHKVGARCYVGRFDRDKEKFFPEQHVRMNWPGGTFFAPESLEGPHGRRIFWAWVTDPRATATQQSTGSGVQSLPRVLSLAKDGTLRITPAKELEALRRQPRTVARRAVPGDGEATVPDVRGDSLELSLEIEPGPAKQVGVKVRCSPDGKEETAVYYNAAAGQLVLDMERSTLRKDVAYSAGPLDGYGSHKSPRSTVEAPFRLWPGEALRLRVFLDGPMLEVFANDRQCVTQQVFPAGRDALGVKAFARGGTATVLGGDAWQMAPARFVNEK